jgi:hypothetical protein
MKKFLIVLVVFYLAFIAFMPKENIYYTLLNQLKSERILITQESLSDDLFSLKGEEISIFYDGIESVNADSFSLLPFGIYNKFEAINVRASKELKKMFKYSADKVEIVYAVWDYKRAKIYAEGDFGTIEGELDILGQRVKLLLDPSPSFEKSPIIREYFKKSEEGYSYESKIN